jgi:transcriptional regulator with XRE-family HTH domain
VDIGSRIRAARRAAGLTQEEVARRAGLTLKAVGEVERGDVRDPHISSLGAIARALEVPVEDLVKEELAVPLDEAASERPPQVSRERLQEHFENVRQNEVDYLNHKVIADVWRLALPGEKPEAHIVPEDIDTDRIWQFLEHALGARNVFGPEEAERIKRGAVRKAALAR